LLRALLRRRLSLNPFKYFFRGAVAGTVFIVLLYLLLVWIFV